MVQLKPRIKLFADVPQLFQFLHGTIKSFLPPLVLIVLPTFQFLHGTIKSWYLSGNRDSLMIFQFLHGTIKRQLALALPLKGLISIPSWYN